MSQKTAGAETSVIDRLLQAFGLRARTNPIAQPDVEPLNEEAFTISVPRDAPAAWRAQIEATAQRYGGRRRGFLRKTWALPIEAYGEIDAAGLLTHARIAPDYKALLDRFALSAATHWRGDSLMPAGFGVQLYPFQEAAVAYLLQTQRCILGDEAGVGKTFPAIAAATHVRQGSVIVVCPASLKLNWKSEIERACPGESVFVCKGRTPRDLPAPDWIVLNYDIVDGWVDALRAIPSNVVILDELHNCKNPAAQRSKACVRLVEGKPYRFGLTGTLFRNRHAEAFNQLHIIGQLQPLGGYTRLLRQYCDGREGISVNSIGFNRRLRQHCYVRREKRDVLAQLPDKLRAHVVVELNGQAAYQQEEAGFIAWLRRIRANPGAWKTERVDALARMNKLRQRVGAGKVVAAIEWIEDFLAQTDEKLVVFAYHRAVQEALVRAFPDALHIQANDPMSERQRAKDTFQADPQARLILCGLMVASEGITLTAASTMLCLELDYVPARLFDQMEGRIDRNGQTQPMQIYYMIANSSLDERMMRLLENKWRIVTAANTGASIAASESIFDELVDELIRADETTHFADDSIARR